MSRTEVTRLDRLFARAAARTAWLAVRDRWEPAWRPRGRWWMRSSGGAGQASANRPSQRVWMRLIRPGRAA